jgi:hypothetical protein
MPAPLPNAPGALPCPPGALTPQPVALTVRARTTAIDARSTDTLRTFRWQSEMGRHSDGHATPLFAVRSRREDLGSACNDWWQWDQRWVTARSTMGGTGISDG